MDYHDFEVKLRSTGGQDYEIDVRSPSGERTSSVRFPFDHLALESRLQALEIALLKSGGTRRDIKFKEEETVEDFGRALFDMMLGGEVRDLYRRSRQKALDDGKGLRIRLRVEAPELASLPWEYMYDEAEGDFVCLSAESPVIRYLALDRPPAPLTISPPIRVLGMVASPNDRTALDVDREIQRIERATAGLREQGLLSWEWLPGGGWRDLQRAMRSGPWHVFHFVGHGGYDPATQEGLLAMVDENGGSFRISATQLGRLLADHHTLRLVVLNSCEGAKGSDTNIFSSTSSILMRRGVPAVVAMQYEITDRAAIEFSQVFYEDIAHGLAVDTAVTEARKAISMSMGSSLEWGTPVLHMRAPDGVLFDIRGTPQPVARDEPAPFPAAAGAGIRHAPQGPAQPAGRAGVSPPPAPPPASTPSSPPEPAGKTWRVWERHPVRSGAGAAVVVFAGLVLLFGGGGGDLETMTQAWDEAELEADAGPGTATVRLTYGFLPDPHEVDVVAGGPATPDQPGCTHGFVPTYPSVNFEYAGVESQPLFFAVNDRNATIHMNLPDGSWVCNDPSFAPYDPLVVVPNALSGTYHIWVGAVDRRQVGATLFISEIDPRDYDDEEDQAGAF
jgi:hypothetical protein